MFFGNFANAIIMIFHCKLKKLNSYLTLFLLAILLSSCELKFKPIEEEEISQLVSVIRYDRLEYRYLTTGDFSALQEMNTEYPIATRTLLESVLQIGEVTDPEINTKFLKLYQDTTLQTLLADTQAEFTNMDDINAELNTAFANLQKFFPGIEIPRVYTQISALDQSIVLGNQIIGISLDKYLGPNYPIYKKFNYSKSQLQQMSREYISPDCLSFYLMSVYPPKGFETRSQMERDLYVGKIQWVVNHALERRFYRSKYVSAVHKFMKSHPKTSYEDLLLMDNYSAFAP